MNTLLIRQWHGYLGALIAPSIIFFAITGSLQIFNLHEAHDGYTPPQIIEKLARVHKDQVFAVKHDDPPPPAEPKPASNQPPAHADDDRPALSTILLKWYFLAVAMGLVVSTAFGIWIGLTRPRGRTTTITLLAAGCALPVLLLAI